MRGGMDGLSVIVPANDANLRRARPEHRGPDRGAAAGVTRASACTRRWRRCTRSGRPARWPPCTRSPRRTPAAATSRPRSASSGAPRPPRPTPAGWTARSPRWVRARRSAPSPRATRCPARCSASSPSSCSTASRASRWPAGTACGTRRWPRCSRSTPASTTRSPTHAMTTVKALKLGPQARRDAVPDRRRRTPAAASPTGSRTWPA